MLAVYGIRQLLALWGTITVALLLFTLIVANTHVYHTAKRFWLMVISAWSVAYVLCAVLFFYFRLDLIFTVMIASLAAYILMGDVLIGRKKAPNTNAEESKHKSETAAVNGIDQKRVSNDTHKQNYEE